MVDKSEKPQEELGSIEFSFKYPFTNKESKYGGIIFGFLMMLASFLIVPLFTLNGYIFKLKENAATGEPEAPKFENWKELTVEGFYAWIVLLAAFVPVLLVSLISSLVSEVEVLGTAMSILLIVTYLVTLAALPLIGVVYSVKRNIVATYTDSELYDVLFSVHYLISIFKYILVAFLVFLLYIIGAIVTLGLGVLILLPLLMYVRPAFWGHVYYKS